MFRATAAWLGMLLACGCARAGLSLGSDASTASQGGSGQDGGWSTAPGSGSEGGAVRPDETGSETGAESGRPGPTDGGNGVPDASGANCGAGLSECPLGCANLTDDKAHCGSCERACPGSAASCANGRCEHPGCTWLKDSGHDYWLCDNTAGKSWADARAFCRAVGMDLIRVETSAEHLFLKSQIAATGGWLGLSDLDTEGSFRWIDPQSGSLTGPLVWTGKSATNGGMPEPGAYVPWASTEPSDGFSAHSENCAYAIGDSWWDGNCNESKPFTCESSDP